jgi:hypothetical protein
MRMGTRLRRIGGLLLRSVAVAAVATKLLIPIGYMPGPLAAGSPIQLCDAGFKIVAAHHEHAALPAHGTHHDHDNNGELQWKHCPSGALAAAGAIPVEHRLDLPPGEAERLPLRDAGQITKARFTAFRARAPPLGA